MHRWTFILAAVLLVGLIPLVSAQEEERKEEQAPAKAKAKPEPGARLLERFDLNKDGRVTWEEFQKVRSGFAFLDADGDGVLTAKDAEQLQKRFAEKRAERMKERPLRGRRFRRPDCDCPCHRDAPRFRGPARGEGPRGFQGRGWERPGRRGERPGRGWERPGRGGFGPQGGPPRGRWERRGPGWGPPGEERPRQGPPPRDDRGPY